MSAEKTEVPVLSLLDQFKQQHAQFVAQRDFAQNNLNQLVGAIFACDMMINKLEDEKVNMMIKKLEAVMDNSTVDSKEQEDGEINDQGKEEPSQE